jgi:prepilin-type N-terminal cleavage/methylation domain-containing protein
MSEDRGFTLMELLVVLLIIGILSTVALRTIDATRDRSLFDQTTKEMNELVQAITGNPDMTYDGRRVDFGYFGDMGKMPGDLRDLVHNPNPGDTNWHGPYVRQTVAGDTAGYLLDGWGHEYTYNPTDGTIASHGNGKYPMTVKVADSPSVLYSNTISGTITDLDNNPPGEKAANITVTLYYSSDHPFRVKSPDQGGFYEFSIATSDTVLVGTHRMVAKMAGGDSVTRWVTVAPRSRTVVDFRFSRSFRNQLRMVGSPVIDPNDTAGFSILVVNDGPTEDTVSWLVFFRTPDSAFMREFQVDGVYGYGYPVPAGQPGTGLGDTARLAAPVAIPPDMSHEVLFQFQKFRVDEQGTDTSTNVPGKEFQFRFSDGSEITVKP